MLDEARTITMDDIVDTRVIIKEKEAHKVAKKTYTCYGCDETYEGDPYAMVYSGYGGLEKVNDTVVRIIDGETNPCCESCVDAGDITFYCYLTEERWFGSSVSFTYVDQWDEYALDYAIEVAGWEWDDDAEEYVQANSKTTEDQHVAKYVDFYWHLRDGERHGVLQIEDGGEEKMAAGLEQKIYKRIEEAGADKGDPNVVNVYTRLQLIDEGLLAKDYVL